MRHGSKLSAAAVVFFAANVLQPPPSQAAVAPPGPAVNLEASPQSTNAVNLKWLDTASNETRFRVEKSVAGGPFLLARNVGANKQQVAIGGLAPGTLVQFRIRAENSGGNSAWSPIAGAFTDRQDAPGTCVPTPTVLCVGTSNRFRVVVQYRGSPSQPLESFGATEVNAETGLFYFPFSDPNAEGVVKILNGCSINTRYWVFAGGLTSIETTITVTDTQNGRTRTYFSPSGKPFVAIQDVSAFATCP